MIKTINKKFTYIIILCGKYIFVTNFVKYSYLINIKTIKINLKYYDNIKIKF